MASAGHPHCTTPGGLQGVLRTVLSIMLAMAGTGASVLAQHVDVGTTVQLDLSRGRFTSAVPFDVDFYIQTTVDETVVRLDGRLLQTGDGSFQCPSSLEGRQGVIALPTARFFQIVEDGVSVKKAELSVPRLQPNAKICLDFLTRSRLNDDRTQQIRMIASRELDLRLRSLDDLDNLAPQDTFDRFRRQVIDGVNGLLTPGEQLADLPAGSFFDEDISAAQVESSYVDAFISILDQQTNKINVIQRFNDVTMQTEEPFRRLLRDPLFQTMTRKLRGSVEETQLLAAPERLRAIELGLSTPADAERLSRGVYPPDDFVPPDLGKLWRAENSELEPDLAEYTERFRRLVSLLRALEELADVLAATPSVRDSVGLGPELEGEQNPDELSETELQRVRDLAGALRSDSNDGSLGTAITTLENLSAALEQRNSSIGALANQVQVAALEQLQIAGTTTADWTTRAQSYVSVDVGTAVVPDIDSVFFYLGTNFYLGPVNKKAPLVWERRGFVRRRLAFLLGVPLNPFSNNENPLEARFKGVLGNRPLLAGIGMRLTDLVRVTGGYAFYRREDLDSPSGSAAIRKAGFVSISVDWDLKGTLGPIGGVPPAGK